MDKILAFIKEAKWFSISIGIFLVIWLGPKLLEGIEENRIKSERLARIEISKSEKKADEVNPLYKAYKESMNKEYLGFVCNSRKNDFEIKFILEKFDGKFIGSKTFYKKTTKGSSDHSIETWISGWEENYANYHKFYENDETISFQIAGKYSYHDLIGNFLILDRNDISFLIEERSLGSIDFAVIGQCTEANHDSLLKEQTEHNFKIKENNVL